MTDWKPGDIALCIRGGKTSKNPRTLPEYPRTGASYKVEKSGFQLFYEGPSMALWFSDAPPNTNGERVWSACRFIKITPEEADEFDKEIIDLYNKKPAKGESVTHTILVYGTLRPFTNEDVVKVPGKLYDLGWFPGIVLGGDSEVTCERITVDDNRLRQLDAYEGYDPEHPEDSLYIRQRIGDDFIYVYNHSVQGHELIESGDWELHTKQMETCNAG